MHLLLRSCAAHGVTHLPTDEERNVALLVVLRCHYDVCQLDVDRAMNDGAHSKVVNKIWSNFRSDSSSNGRRRIVDGLEIKVAATGIYKLEIDIDTKKDLHWKYAPSECRGCKGGIPYGGLTGQGLYQSFCLVTDARIHVNMRMRGYYDDRTVVASILKGGKAVRTWIRELGILWIDAAGVKHSFRMAARDGKEMARGAGYMGEMDFAGKALPLLSGGGFFDVDAYSLEVDGLIKLDVKLRPAHPLLQTEADAQTHINLHFASVERTPAMHGIMGQTYREGRRKRALEYTSLSVLLRRSFAADGVEGRGYLDGEVKDYRTSSVMSADCLYTAFDGHTLPPINEANGVLVA
ncbi:unnamed protein product [Closterium sp. NIES-64]|nr:unnamed protein product [Closterium sp. NIES-64]